MPTLSSRATFLYKRVSPTIFVCCLALFIAIPLVVGWNGGEYPPLPFFIGPIAMFLFFWFLMKKLVFDMVDEVVDLGDALLVKNGSQTARIALSEIVNVNYTPLFSPPRVTLLLRRPSLFGTQVTFCAPLRLVPFSRSPVIDQLIERVDAARRAASRT